MYLIHLWYSSCSNELRKEHHFSLSWSETHTELDNCRNLSSFGLTLFIKGELTCQCLTASTKQKGALGAPSPSCFRLLLFTSLNPCSALSSQIRCLKRLFDCQSSIPLRNKQSFTLSFTQIHSGWPIVFETSLGLWGLTCSNSLQVEKTYWPHSQYPLEVVIHVCCAWIQSNAVIMQSEYQEFWWEGKEESKSLSSWIHWQWKVLIEEAWADAEDLLQSIAIQSKAELRFSKDELL